MRAWTVIPGKAGSASVSDVPEPTPEMGPLLIEAVATGVCGTDREITEGQYGWAPPGHERLVLGHESLGRVLEAPDGGGLAAGDLVVGIVRRRDPVPCANCAVGEWDMCTNGRYTEHGIKELDGYCVERYRLEPRDAVKLAPTLARVGVLLEPTSVVAKAWEHVEHIGRRARWEPRRVLVTGAGPIGLLAALLGVQRGLEVHVMDRTTTGPKPELVRDLGGIHHAGSTVDPSWAPDIVIETTGVGQLVIDVIARAAPGAIVCLTGIASGGPIPIDVAALNKDVVLQNKVVFGSVNANRRHYEAAADALARADVRWLERIITRRIPLVEWADGVSKKPGDVKTVIDFTL